MTRSAPHLFVTATTRAARRDTFGALAAAKLTVSCHARRRGPYSGVGDILATVVPDAHRRWPELVDTHRIELLFAVPELAAIIGPGPESLVSITPHEERTRYAGHGLVRAMSQGIVTFLIAYARRSRDADDGPLTIALDDIDAAEFTEQELAGLVVRRADPAVLRVVVGAGQTPLPADLQATLRRSAQHVDAPAPAPADDHRTPAELTSDYVLADGTSDDPAEISAYEAAGHELRGRLHDERAAALDAEADQGLRLGAIPYHRERGTDPTGAGRHALRAALEICLAAGYSAAIVDFGMRGRVLCDPVIHQQDYCHFTAKAASALVPLGRPAECAELYHELRRRYALPRVQMTCSYAIAILHTRFLRPRDHETALEWANNARALASMEDDPVDGPYFQVFQDNGLALIEMHRGNLDRALELIDRGVERLDRDLPADRYLVHRSQLLHNRARLLLALGRLDDAYAEWTRLIDWDPNYFEYHTDRANLSIRLGDLVAALADIDRAIAVAPPLPEVYCTRADLRAQIGDAEGAMADLEALLDMEPDFVPGRLLRSTLRLAAGDPHGADHDVRAGLDVDPHDPRLLSQLALVQQAAGSNADALESFAGALQVDPGFMPALLDRAVLAFEVGQTDLALDDLTRALELGGENADVLFNRGFVLEHARRFEDAVDDFTRALALPDADRQELIAHRASALIELGRLTSAADDIRALAELDPERSGALDAILRSRFRRAA
ncbi:MAG TPA: tetratricopeptide repeat protein [Solirubrobacteraceae bacterium]